MDRHVFLASEAPSSWSRDAKTLDVVWYGGNPVERMGGVVLVFDWGGADLSRLNASAPVFDSHGPRDYARPGFPTPVSEQVGCVVAGSAKVEGSGEKRRGVCTLKLAEVKETESLIAKIDQGVVPKLSMGADILDTENITGTDRAKRALAALGLETDGDYYTVYSVTQWRPKEVSFVTIPADHESVALNEQNDSTMVVKKNTRAASGTQDSTPAEASLSDPNPGTAPAPTPAPQPAPAPAPAAPESTGGATELCEAFGFSQADLEEALGEARAVELATKPSSSGDNRRAESYRQRQIRAAGAALGVDQATVDALVDGDETLAEARGTLINAKRQRQPTMRPQTTLGADERDKFADACLSSLEVRLGISDKFEHGGADLAGMSLARLGEEICRREGIRLSSRAPADIFLALHDSSDFPKITSNLANKALLDAYEAAPRTWASLAARRSVSDFKANNALNFEGVLTMAKLQPGAEIQFGTLAESQEAWALFTYASGLGLTRQMFVNDDLDALDRIARGFADAGAEMQSNVVWGLLLNNVVMADGLELFSGGHNNLGSRALSIQGLDEMRKAMRLQKKLDGVTPANITPTRLFLPAGLETVGQQLVASTAPTTTEQVNVFRGTFDRVEIEPRLDAVSSTAWFGAANPAARRAVEYGFLGGATGPKIEDRVSWTRDGLELRAIMDFGAGAVDYRPLYKSTGTVAPS